MSVKYRLMKQLISVLTIAAMMAACNSNSGTTAKQGGAATPDTAGMAQFKAWKEENAKKALIDSVKKADAARLEAESKTAKSTKSTTSKSASRYKSESLAYETANPAKQKKGWSKKAKG